MTRKILKKFSTVRMQLVFSVFVAIAPALVLTYLVNRPWFWQFAPEWLKRYALDVPWTSFVVGFLALIAAWFGGEHFILRQVRALSDAAQRFAKGDLSARTGLEPSEDEFGQLAKIFDGMAESLQQRINEREKAERILLNRALQQTAIAALGQFALTESDIEPLLNQAGLLVAHTLELEYSAIWERLPDGQLLLQAGAGWKRGCVGETKIPTDNRLQPGLTLNSGEMIIIPDFKTETQFIVPPLFTEHGVVGGVTVAIPTRGRPFGVLGAHVTRRRDFTPDELQFLMAVATVLGMAVERRRAEAETIKLAAFAKLNPAATMEIADDGTISYFNHAAQQLALSARKKHPREVLPPEIKQIVSDCLSSGQSQVRLETKMNSRAFSWLFHPVLPSRVVHCYVEDITERLNLEEQLRQSQKMESVGQLAAGVAHDFNNMLTIIQGHSSALLAKPTLPADVLDPLQSVYFAAERAAGLTRQLLMFSRKNVIQPSPLDLREVVGNMSRMLERLLGETIHLEFRPPPELPAIEGDVGMIEQVIMNLSVNARDAMPKGGILTISLDTLTLDEDYVKSHADAHAGRHVRLRIADTGMGMDAATLRRIFEPFFTTKEVGKGTGLGLATVYGIVKQHDGWLEVSSEPNKGATFDVFFPASEKTIAPKQEKIVLEESAAGGNESILIVEDEPILREMARDILSGYGYHIFEAPSGREALDTWQDRTNEIDLLLTDMVMPDGVSGAELARQLRVHHPGLKIIFTSGYTANEINTQTLVKMKARYLQKPYSHADLARTVRECLDKDDDTATVLAPL
jgi:nitrogen-specific signal transduction histidine kinase/HAMP domain-containing protein/ActR/RegA family two-component response regulator